MTIRYKVVKNRVSVMSKKMPKGLSKRYLKGKVVKAREGTFGIFVFKTRSQAEEWSIYFHNAKVLRVEGIGRGRKAPKYVPLIMDHLSLSHILRTTIHILKGYTNIDAWGTPEGTICYDAVKVLD